MVYLIPEGVMRLFREFGLPPSVSMADSQNEYDHVRTTSSRRENRDYMYARLKPSHRIAFQEFRRSGIVLPFGVASAHFNFPSASLSLSDGKRLQMDYGNPLAGWG
jgi:hypothetical protein